MAEDTQGQGQANANQPVDNSDAGAVKTPDVNQADNFKALRQKAETAEKQAEEYKSKLAQYETKAEKDKEAKLKEEGKYKELLEAKEKEISETKRNVAVKEALYNSQANPKYSAVIENIIKSNLQFTDTGNNLEQVIIDAKATYPEFFSVEPAKPAGNIGAGITNSNSTGGMTLDRAMEIVNSGNNAEYMKYQKEISEVISKAK